MILVTGASRSGTTLVGQLLGRHSQIAGLKELHYFGDSWSPRGENRTMTSSEARLAVETLFERQIKVSVGAKGVDHSTDIEAVLASIYPQPGSTDIFAATVAFFATHAGKRIPCEQTPRNIYYARSLLKEFPEARVIHLLRDPRAVLASQKSRWRKRSMLQNPSRMSRLQQLRVRFNYHPYSVARLWNRATYDALQLQDHPRFRTLKFESLIAEPERHVRELCTFLGLDFETGMLDVQHTNSSHVVSTGQQAGFSKAPIDAWCEVLTRNEVAVISQRCGALMTQTGYPVEQSAISLRARSLFALRYVLHVAGALVINPRRFWIQARALLRTKQTAVQPTQSVALKAPCQTPHIGHLEWAPGSWPPTRQVRPCRTTRKQTF